MSYRVGSRYVLRDQLGQGGFGAVWRADGPDGEVAVKVLRPELTADPEVVSRFVRERQVVLGLRHPHLVQVLDLVVEGDVLALVMELVDGPSLRSHLDRHGPLPVADAASVVADVAEALTTVHANAVVHRDVKPANVLLRRTEPRPAACLTDFGVARLLEATVLTMTQVVIGTPGYLAPELVRGEPARPAVDIYACGVLLYELVTGATPFPAEHPLAVLLRHVNDEPKQPPGMPDTLWSITSRCLGKDPAHRPDAAELTALLRDVGNPSTMPLVTHRAPSYSRTRRIAGPQPTAINRIPDVPSPVSPERPRRRWPWVVAAAVAAGLAGLLAGAAFGYWAGALNPAASSDSATTTPATSATTTNAHLYLEQLPVTQVTNGLGPVGLGSAVGGDAPDDGGTLTVGGVQFEHGFGTHAPSQIRAYPGGTCGRFTSTVGIDGAAADQGGGSVTFQVFGDGTLLHDTGPLTAADQPATLDVDISGYTVLDLVVTDAGDGNELDHADWADAQLHCTT